jgi:uncharacterized protein (DUF305 family)
VSLPSAAIAAVSAAVLLVSCSGPSDRLSKPAPHADQPVVSGEPAGSNASDVSFAEAVVAQDQQAIDLAALVPDRSSNSNVVAAATASANTRRSEVSVLRVLLVQWNVDQDSVNGNMAKGLIDQAAIAKLRALRGSAFEMLWLHTMLGLSEAGLEIATAEITGGKNVDAVDVAHQISEARRAEIGQLNTML